MVLCADVRSRLGFSPAHSVVQTVGRKFDTLHYQAMAVYKIFILVFNLTPYLALRILT